MSSCAPKWDDNNGNMAKDITEDNIGSFWRLGALLTMVLTTYPWCTL